MNEVTPDLIAQIATQLFNGVPQPDGIPNSAPYGPSVPTGTPLYGSVPYESVPYSSFPQEAVPFATGQSPAGAYPAAGQHQNGYSSGSAATNPYASVPSESTPHLSTAHFTTPQAAVPYGSGPFLSGSHHNAAPVSLPQRPAPYSSGSHLTDALTSVPHSTSAPGYVSNSPHNGGVPFSHEHFQTGSSYFPTSSLPAQGGIPHHPGISARSAERYAPSDVQGHAPHGIPQDLQSVSGQSGTGFSGGRHQVADISPDGLRNFVNQIRNPVPDVDHGFCPGSPGISFLKQILTPPQLPQPPLSGARPFDLPSIRRDFPALHQRVHGKQLVWFDNAATTQKPQQVIDAISYYYAHDNSNIHRAAHSLAARSTDAFEGVRDKVHQFLGAASSKEIIFVRGTTEGVNLIAQTYGRKFLQPGDEIVMSMLEHHANIVPWQMVAKEKGAVLRVIPVNDRGEVILEEYQALLGPKTKFVALTQASNSLGTILPVAEMTQMAKRYGARVLIDGAQSVSHIPVNVQEIGCDFFVFSGHKIFGPTGIGAVYARQEVQEIMPPWQGGGNMIKNVTFEETSYSDPPNKFEAGTPNIADVVGLGAALDYVQSLGLNNIGKYEHHLLHYATERLLPIDGLRIVGQAREKVSVISFVLKDFRTEEVGKLLDLEGIAVRAGHHCSQPSLRRYGLDATVRPSFAFYNTTEEIDHLVSSVKRISSRSVNFSQGAYGTYGARQRH